MIKEVLNKMGLADIDYEDLNEAEKETVTSWIAALEKNELTVDKVKDYLATMRASVAAELGNHLVVSFEDRIKDALLKARLRNYTLLENFLQAPDKARKAMERAINSSGVKGT